MNIEMLSTEKLKVVLNTGDLDKYDLDYMSISSESSKTRVMVRDILARARTSGFSTKNCKLLIEVLPGKNSGCVLYLTKLPKPASVRVDAPHGRQADTATGSAQSSAYCLSCGCFDDTVGAVHCFANYPEVPLLRSSLYDYEGKYHLVFAPVGAGGEKLGALLTCLSEYGQTGALSEVSEAVLAEHGSAISNGRAVEKMLRFFY